MLLKLYVYDYLGREHIASNRMLPWGRGRRA